MTHEYSKSGVNLSVCAYCLKEVDQHSRTVDHLYPKSRGGKLSNANKVVACGDCNKLKGSLNVKEFDRALSSLIFYEQEKHKKSIGLLKKIKYNTQKIIERYESTISKNFSIRTKRDTK